MRSNNHAKAMEECGFLSSFVTGFECDLFDFHTYSLRKLTLTAYKEYAIILLIIVPAPSFSI